MLTSTRSQLIAIILAALAVVGLTTVGAAKADTTRVEYVAQAEPICQTNADANRRILKGVRAKAKSGKRSKLRAAGRQFARAAAAFAETVAQIRAIPQPAADTTALARWLFYLDRESTYLRRISKALKKRKTAKAQGFAVRLQRNANFANGAVVGFGFNHCLIEPSRFT